jgi:hypothetical protein
MVLRDLQVVGDTLPLGVSYLISLIGYLRGICDLLYQGGGR